MADSDKTIISPSVLASNLGNLTEEVKKVQSSGAQWVHMDVMDGHFVPTISLGIPVLKSVYDSVPGIFMDCHMMVEDPEHFIPQVAEAGGKSFTFHYEVTGEEKGLELVDIIHKSGMQAAVAINPKTPSSAITDALGSKVDMILVMTVQPGYGGQKLIPECVPKVKELRERFPQKHIQVDGGVNEGTIGQCACAGSNVVVAGTGVFKAASVGGAIDDLKKAVDDARPSWPRM